MWMILQLSVLVGMQQRFKMIANLVFQQSDGVGSGSLALTAVDGWRTFEAAFGTGSDNQFRYTIRHKVLTEYEIGIGYIDSGGLLVRNTVIESSNSDSVVAFSGGTKEVVCAVDVLYLDGFKNADPIGVISDADGTLEDLTLKFNQLLAGLRAAGILAV